MYAKSKNGPVEGSRNKTRLVWTKAVAQSIVVASTPIRSRPNAPATPEGTEAHFVKREKEERERYRFLKKESEYLNFIKMLENMGDSLRRSEGIKRKEEEMGLRWPEIYGGAMTRQLPLLHQRLFFRE